MQEKNKKIKILLVDDQPIVAATIENMLDNYSDDYQIEFEYCQEPKQALKTAVNFKPTVILQDLILPDGYDGFTLVKIYRANTTLKNTPILVLSNKYEPEVKVKAFQAGANDYFEKRFDIKGSEKELMARIIYHSMAYLAHLERDQAYESLEREIKKAAEYIHSILPEPFENDKIKTDWRHIPSTSLSGDSFDYAWLDDNNFAFYLLDVSGHGIGSALLSISVLNVLRSTALGKEIFMQPSKVLSYLNKRFPMSKQNDLYFTMWYGVYNTESRMLKYAGGAHPPAVLRVNNETQSLASQNFLIGGLPDFEFTESTIKITDKADLFLFSDGAYEIMKPDKTMWTHEELSEYISQNQAETILDDLYEYLKKIGDIRNLDDDYTILRLTLK